MEKYIDYMNKKNFYFASANTGAGFVNFLGKIPGFMYIVKGGSGTGKSTLMKKVASHFFEKGFDVEYYYCSTDPQSLDGIRIPEKNIVMVDGTSPHVVNPYLLGVTAKVVDVGQFISDDIIAFGQKLEGLCKQKESHYAAMYKILKSAKVLDEVNFDLAQETIQASQIKKSAKILFSKIKKIAFHGSGKSLFLQSINPDIADLEKANKFQNITFLANRYEGFLILNELEKMLLQHKIEHLKILDPLCPEQIKNIVINNKVLIKPIDKKLKTQQKIENNKKIIKKLLFAAKQEILCAKKLHLQIEDIYISKVDFNGVQSLTQKTIEEISLR